jgi:hypothetical protein
MFALQTLRHCAADTIGCYDAASLSGDEAVSALRILGEARRLIDTMIASTTRRVEATAAYKGRGDRSTADTAAKALGASTHEARTFADAGKAIEADSTLSAAAKAGKVTPAQAALIGETLEHAPEAAVELLTAVEGGIATLRDKCIEVRNRVESESDRRTRQRRSRSLSMWTDKDGMACGTWRLQPEVGASVKALIDARTESTLRARKSSDDHEPIAAYAADAFVELVVDDRRRREAVAVKVHVVIDHAALVRGEALPGERCEIPGVGPVSVEWVRDLLGDAFLTATIANGVDIHTVAHFGRHINATLRTALLVQGRECDIEQCGQRGYLEIDHHLDHAKRGPTALHNLGWLCAHHHRLKTQGWILSPPHPDTGKHTLAPPATPAVRAA